MSSFPSGLSAGFAECADRMGAEFALFAKGQQGPSLSSVPSLSSAEFTQFVDCRLHVFVRVSGRL